jgi:hypothetical protein
VNDVVKAVDSCTLTKKAKEKKVLTIVCQKADVTCYMKNWLGLQCFDNNELM